MQIEDFNLQIREVENHFQLVNFFLLNFSSFQYFIFRNDNKLNEKEM